MMKATKFSTLLVATAAAGMMAGGTAGTQAVPAPEAPAASSPTTASSQAATGGGTRCEGRAVRTCVRIVPTLSPSGDLRHETSATIRDTRGGTNYTVRLLHHQPQFYGARGWTNMGQVSHDYDGWHRRADGIRLPNSTCHEPQVDALFIRYVTTVQWKVAGKHTVRSRVVKGKALSVPC